MTSFHAWSEHLFPPLPRRPAGPPSRQPAVPPARLPRLPAARPAAPQRPRARLRTPGRRRATAQTPRPEQARQPSSAVARAAGTQLPPLSARRTPRSHRRLGPEPPRPRLAAAGGDASGKYRGPLAGGGVEGRRRPAVGGGGGLGTGTTLCGKTGSSLGWWRRGEHCGVQGEEASELSLAWVKGRGAPGSRVMDAPMRWRPRIRSGWRDAESWEELGERRICGEGSLRCFVCIAPSVIAAVPFERLEVEKKKKKRKVGGEDRERSVGFLWTLQTVRTALLFSWGRM